MCSLERAERAQCPDLEVIVGLDLVQDLETIVVAEEAQMIGEGLTRETGLQICQGKTAAS